ncbi:HAD superfamily hydrolase (TIGR01509 family) [Enterococcus sp. PF1-24]|uniref:HAD family hydrolase n=1 Tax=unclassified Enterococcus TaxID=2608891 RepID=UPI002474D667|nr:MULTISPECIES: HAD family phosphatase [unclassified Enterococcus]MDH6365797.1 HAD superfamily hydrolase (TIGR01509 family) [Enterococcus sp. PFB1-1]MDH6402897.1 HAD superfamily hydrolase (TIGR01509 family) [Enterococcus sp. PF1-24]
MKKVKGIIFDMDGLIFDTETVYYQASQTTADKLGFPYSKAEYLKYLGISDEELWAAYHEVYAEFGSEKVQQFIDEAFAESNRMIANGEVAVKPGLFDLLTYLNEAQIPKIIASSNQRQVIDAILAVSDLQAEFPEIVSFENVKRAKPNPEIFELAAKRLGLAKDEILVLEDSPNGVLAAEAAGIPVIMIPDLIAPSAELREKTVAVLPSLSEVVTFLEK